MAARLSNIQEQQQFNRIGSEYIVMHGIPNYSWFIVEFNAFFVYKYAKYAILLHSELNTTLKLSVFIKLRSSLKTYIW